MNIQLLFLTCANDKEAKKITQVLLNKKLIVCAKKTPVSSTFLWEGALDSAEEVLLIMDSIAEKLDDVEKEVRKLHSYDTPVLIAVPVSKTTKDIKGWISEELKPREGSVA